MFVSIDWIKDFTKIPDIDPAELGRRFTMATCEVESVDEVGGYLKNVVVSEIVSIRKHPDSEHLNLVTVRLAEDDNREIICGAPNVQIGMKVPFAPIGTTLPGGFTLTPKKIRGILSEGMLCSQSELDLGDDDSGLYNLPSDAPVGLPLSDYLNIGTDIVFDIDNKSITHRPDLWGHYGMAREFAALFGNKLAPALSNERLEKLNTQLENESESPIVPVIEDGTCCKAYLGASLKNIKVCESPEWMKRRLTVCGVRPINNIVDISNYVMLELGIPMHIFDRDLIEENKIIIRQAGANTVLKTLDDIDRNLIPTDTVVADGKKPLVIAGIMGGASSGISDVTKNIFVEVANWRDSEVRKTSTRVGLRTESSQRYEKSLDSMMLKTVMLRALELILELCPEAELVGKIESVGSDLENYTPLEIEIHFSNIRNILGKAVPDSEIISILKFLEFDIDETSESQIVKVPSFRATKDIEFEADIAEEIGRMIGYDNIEPKPPVKAVLPVSLSNAKKLYRKVEDFMVLNAAAYQIYTNPMIGESLLNKSEWSTTAEDLKLLNAISNDHDRMRPSMIPSILEASALNAKNYNHFKLFELGRSYNTDSKKFSVENNNLIISFHSSTESPFIALANTLERLIAYTGIPAKLEEVNPKFPNTVISREWVGLHPFENLDIKIMGRNHGTIFSLHPIMMKKFKIRGYLSIAVIDFSLFENNEVKDKVSYKPLPRFPASEFDCTVMADKEVYVGKILSVFRKKKVKYMTDIKIADIFEFDNGQKSVTLRATIFDPEKTLHTELLTETKNTIVKILDDAGYPLKM